MGTTKSAKTTAGISSVTFRTARQHKRAKAAKSTYGKAKKTAVKHLKVGSKTASKALHRQLQAKRLRLRLFAIVYILLITFAAATAVALSQRNQHQRVINPFSAGQQAAAGFTLYYPARLPDTYQIDAASLTTVQQSIVNMRLGNGNNATITITQQRPPAGFKFDTLYNTFGNRQSFKVKLGTVTSGTIDDGKTYLSSLVTPDNTWILMSSANQLPQKDLQLIFGNLEATKPD